MEDELIELISSHFKLPIFRQGSLSEDEAYPDHFFTFWNVRSDGDGFYDNDEHCINHIYNLNFYSIDPERTYSALNEAKRILKKHGFAAFGLGHDVASDEPTHTGRGIDITCKQLLN